MVERINCSHPQAGKWVREVKVTEPECCVRGWSPGTCQFLSSEPHSTGYLVRPRDLKRSGPLALSLVPLLRYQFNPAFFQTTVTAQILLKALTNLPHTDFTLCKCMIDQAHVSFQLIRLAGCVGRGGGKVDELPGKWSVGSATNSWIWCSTGWDILVAATDLAPALTGLTVQ